MMRHPRTRAGSGPPARRLVASLCALVVVATGCGTLPTGSPSPTASAGPSAQASPVVLADTIRIALPAGFPYSFSLPFGPADTPIALHHFIHDALYRFGVDARPIPSLARRCDPSPDGLTVTCELADAIFQNGDPVTADDVVFSYDLMAAHRIIDTDPPFLSDCIGVAVNGGSGCLWEILDSATKVDDRTVAFRLKRRDGSFITTVLPRVWIVPEKVVQASYERFRGKAVAFAAADMNAAAKRLLDVANAPGGNCAAVLPDAQQLAARTGLFVPDRAEYDSLPGGEFDACAYARDLGVSLAHAVASLAAQGTTAIAHVFWNLDLARSPVGAGPYRVASYVPNKQLTLEAWPGYHGGTAATHRIVIDIYPSADAAAQAVATRHADWTFLLDPQPLRQLAGTASLRTANAALPIFFEVRYNVRAGHLFSDPRLREAMERCVDKPAAVAAATDGFAIPAYGEGVPGTWAYDDQLPGPTRDVAAAKALIETAGWALGEDGVYRKDGKRLAATIYLRHDDPTRVKFAEIVGLQTRECGFAITPSSGDFDTLLGETLSWPNLAPDTHLPFDLYLGGWITPTWDTVADLFDSEAITTQAHPDGSNYGGFSDPQIDDLLRQVRQAVDIDARADAFHRYQERLAAARPALFGWFAVRAYAATAGLRYQDGPIDLTAPLWYAYPERLVVESSSG
jgi:ABC-type transport system substrate-binding protein